MSDHSNQAGRAGAAAEPPAPEAAGQGEAGLPGGREAAPSGVVSQGFARGAPRDLPRVLITLRVFPDLLEMLRRDCDVIDNQDDLPWSAAELSRRMADVDGVLVDPGRRIDASLLAACPRLCVVSNIAVGYNNLDLAACTAAGIAATNTPDVLTDATADHAWALLLAAARRVVESDRWTRAGNWAGFAFDAFLGADVHGATLGILGMGRIGQAIARRAQGFSMRVIYHNRQQLAADPLLAGAQWVEKDQLLREADFLVVLVPYGPATHHLLGAGEFARMKPGSVLVNIARGGVLDDVALVDALRAGRPGAAALDVMENEPDFHPGLLGLENIVLTPHIGSATRSARRAMVGLAMQNLASVLRGERPAALLNPAVWDTRRRYGAR
jgi:lactate dehydrogenase-like 2-hydroxyacid dehydrogenase